MTETRQEVRSYLNDAQFVGVETLKPNPLNPYKHSKKQVDLLSKIISAHGWRRPIIVSKRSGAIVSGHARLMAAKLLGLATVPVDFQDFESEEQETAVLLADNQIDEFRQVEKGKLEEIALNLGPDFNFELAAMPDFFLPGVGSLNPDGPAGDPKEVAAPRVKPGEVWALGDHRLACGDSTDPALVKLLLNGAEPQLLVTDPPYGVSYDPTWRAGKGVADLVGVGKVENDDQIGWRAAFELFPGSVAYVWHAGRFCREVGENLEAAGFEVVSQIIWAKQRLVMGRGDYHWQHEPCWYAVRKGKTHLWGGSRNQTTLWEIQNLNTFGGNTTEEKTGHGTQKPVECMARPMRNHEIETVYDPFVGSGTSIIAAQMTKRKCYAVEISPEYATIALERFEKFANKKGERIA